MVYLSLYIAVSPRNRSTTRGEARLHYIRLNIFTDYRISRRTVYCSSGAVVDRSAAIRPPPMMELKGEYPDRLSLSLHLHHPSRAVTAPPFGTTLATSGVHHHTLPMGMGAPLHLTSMITTAINMLGLVPGGDCPDVARATMCAQQTSTTASPSMASML